MFKKFFLILIISIFYLLLSTQDILAGTIGTGITCPHVKPDECVPGYSCRIDPTGTGDYICQSRVGIGINCESSDPDPCIIGASCKIDPTGTGDYICQSSATQPNPIASVFGTIQPPGPLSGLVKNNPTGAGAISQILSNLIALIYMVAGIVLVFMFAWGAFEWLTSGGDKEKIAAAQRRLISAVVGILLFAIAFVIIRVLGVFTGFTFFQGQNIKIINSFTIECPDGQKFSVTDTTTATRDQLIQACKGHGT